MENETYYDSTFLRELGNKTLIKAGVDKLHANIIVDALIWTNLRGVDSHGIRLLPHYVKAVTGGRLNKSPTLSFNESSECIAQLDADHTFGHLAGVKAINKAIEIASIKGCGIVSVKNSSHCGALSYYGHLAAQRDMIGIIFTHATARVLTPLSTRSFFGNNPICFVAPMKNEDPFSFDAATTATTFNAVRAACDKNEKLPMGVAADINGGITEDPKLVTQLLPIGGYKGFGLSMMVDILCGVLSGMPCGKDVSKMFEDPMDKKRRLGHFFMVLDIDKFLNIDHFKENLQELVDKVRNEPSLDHTKKIIVPGDPEKNTYKIRNLRGIPLTDLEISSIKKLSL